MADNRIHPTYHCFDDALDLVADILLRHPEIVDDLRLVHAICTSPDGHHYSHAWVEDNQLVFFAGIRHGRQQHFLAMREEYYHDLGVVGLTSYSVQEACRLNLASGHYGPWEERYRELTRQPG